MPLLLELPYKRRMRAHFRLINGCAVRHSRNQKQKHFSRELTRMNANGEWECVSVLEKRRGTRSILRLALQRSRIHTKKTNSQPQGLWNVQPGSFFLCVIS